MRPATARIIRIKSKSLFLLLISSFISFTSL